MLSRWALGPRGVAIAGEGIGGQGALRLSFLHPNLFPVVAAIAPSVEFQEWYNADTPLQEMYDSKEQCRQDTASLHIHPTEFPPHIFFCSNRAQPHWWRGGDRLHEKLAALGIGHTVDLQSRADQPRDYFERMWPAAMRFLIGGLEKESRRLV
jgi:S-formylglutathione hydrolase